MEIEIATLVINGIVKLIVPPSRSTEVSVALCRVFDLKFNGIHLAQVIFKLWVVYGQNIIDVPVCEIEPRCQLFPSGWEQIRYNSALYESRNMSARRGAKCSHWNADFLLENLFRKNHENGVYQKLKYLDDIIFRVQFLYLFLESEYSFTKYIASSWPNTRYLSLQLPVLKMKEFRIILASLLFSLSRGIVV